MTIKRRNSLASLSHWILRRQISKIKVAMINVAGSDCGPITRGFRICARLQTVVNSGDEGASLWARAHKPHRPTSQTARTPRSSSSAARFLYGPLPDAVAQTPALCRLWGVGQPALRRTPASLQRETQLAEPSPPFSPDPERPS